MVVVAQFCDWKHGFAGSVKPCFQSCIRFAITKIISIPIYTWEHRMIFQENSVEGVLNILMKGQGERDAVYRAGESGLSRRS